jgi:hypothetical protein
MKALKGDTAVIGGSSREREEKLDSGFGLL